MNRRISIISFAILLLLILLAACTPKKTVKPGTEPRTKARTMVESDQETGDESVTAGNIPPEDSSRGLNFSTVINVTFEDVNFGFDQYILTQEAMDILARDVEILKKNPKVVVQVEGHADERGTIEYNLALGQKRASAVRNYLITAGVDSHRVFTISYGKERPLDTEHNEEAWARNRRAHLVPAVK